MTSETGTAKAYWAQTQLGYIYSVLPTLTRSHVGNLPAAIYDFGMHT